MTDLKVLRLINYNYKEITYKVGYIQFAIPDKSSEYEKQKKKADEIADFYEKNGYGISFIKKSSDFEKMLIPQILSLKLGGELCFEFYPTEPGFNLNKIYDQRFYNKKTPFIVVFEGANVMLKKIINGISDINPEIRTEIKNLNDYSVFMDRINNGLYPNIIVLFISEDSLDDIGMKDHKINLVL